MEAAILTAFSRGSSIRAVRVVYTARLKMRLWTVYSCVVALCAAAAARRPAAVTDKR